MEFGVLQKIAHPRIVPVRGDENLQDGLRLAAQLGDYGMETVDESALGHAGFVFGPGENTFLIDKIAERLNPQHASRRVGVQLKDFPD
jgi:hypothetical protein